MTFRIQLKSSTTTKTPLTSDLIKAELAYSFVTGDSDGGDRLYIGYDDSSVVAIGGKYYTDMMDHTKGVVKASSAIITDADNKINQLTIDTLAIDGSSITTTGTDLSLITPGTVIIGGDLQVNGTTTTINSTTVTVNDKNIVLADSAVDAAAANGAGITIEGADASILYASAGDKFVFNKPIEGQYLGFDSDFDVSLASKTTDNLVEGSGNLYFSNERVDDRVAALLHAGEGIDLTYTDASNQLSVSVELASTLNAGMATFDSQDFLVTGGNVEIQTIDCGTY